MMRRCAALAAQRRVPRPQNVPLDFQHERVCLLSTVALLKNVDPPNNISLLEVLPPKIGYV